MWRFYGIFLRVYSTVKLIKSFPSDLETSESPIDFLESPSLSLDNDFEMQSAIVFDFETYMESIFPLGWSPGYCGMPRKHFCSPP